MGSNNADYIKEEGQSDSNNGNDSDSSTTTVPLLVGEEHGSGYSSCTENELNNFESEEDSGSDNVYMFQYSPLSDEDQPEEKNVNPDDVSEENLQSPVCQEPTRSCNNSKMKTVPILSYRRTGKIRMENVAQAQQRNWNWIYGMIYAPQETI